VPVDDLARKSTPLSEAIARLRRGDVIREAGYDGEYGVIRLFGPGELTRSHATAAPGLFDDALFATEVPAPAAAEKRVPVAPKPEPAPAPEPKPVTVEAGHSFLDGLDPDQRAAAEVAGGPLLIVAGPGTGKTRTL